MTDAPFKKLSIQEQRFCEAYVDHGNATRAAKEAGYSEKAAHVQGCRLLKRDNVTAYIDAIRTERWKRAAMGEDEWKALVSEQARNPLASMLFFTSDGDPIIDLANAPPEALKHVKEIKVEDFIDKREIGPDGKPIAREVRAVTIKMVDPAKGREMIGRHLGLLAPKADEAIGSFVEFMVEAHRRAEKGKEPDNE